MEQPPYSLDLNPIENLQQELKQLVNTINPKLKNTTGDSEEIRARFTSIISRVWASIPARRIRGLIKLIDNRMNAIIEAKGQYTSY